MAEQTRVIIIGGGGVGTVAAFNLESGGLATVSMVLRSNYQAVLDHGFHIDSYDHGVTPQWRPSGGIFNSVSAAAEKKYDFVVCCTKNIPDPSQSLADLLRRVVTTGHSTIVLIQNGVNIENQLIATFPANVVLSGVSLCGAYEPEPGRIIHNDSDKLLVGASDRR